MTAFEHPKVSSGLVGVSSLNKTARSPSIRSPTNLVPPSPFQHSGRPDDQRGSAHRRPSDEPSKSLYKHNPCPLLHSASMSDSRISDTSAAQSHNSEVSTLNQSSSYIQTYKGLRARDTVKSWLLSHHPNHIYYDNVPFAISLVRNLSEASASSQTSTLSDLFDINPTHVTLSNGSDMDMNSVTDSCVSDNSLRTAYEFQERETSKEVGEGGEDDHCLPPPREVPTQAKLQAGLYTCAPLTPTNLQRYMDAYTPQRKSRNRRPPQSSESSNSQTQSKSGWQRMQESMRRMEREAASKREQKQDKGSRIAAFKAVTLPWY